MVTDLQYIAIVLYLVWCLVSSLSGAVNRDHDKVPLVRHPDVEP